MGSLAATDKYTHRDERCLWGSGGRTFGRQSITATGSQYVAEATGHGVMSHTTPPQRGVHGCVSRPWKKVLCLGAATAAASSASGRSESGTTMSFPSTGGTGAVATDLGARCCGSRRHRLRTKAVSFSARREGTSSSACSPLWRSPLPAGEKR